MLHGSGGMLDFLKHEHIVDDRTLVVMPCCALAAAFALKDYLASPLFARFSSLLFRSRRLFNTFLSWGILPAPIGSSTHWLMWAIMALFVLLMCLRVIAVVSGLRSSGTSSSALQRTSAAGRGCGKDHFAMHRRLWRTFSHLRTRPRCRDARRQEPDPIAARDKPWIFRTYAGHSTAAKSNELYRNNLAKGQTGLSIAFDLPTQTGYDSDHELASGEVGKVGVPVSHLGDMRTLLDGIPLDQMNTSMTINATAAWLLSLYVASPTSRARRAPSSPAPSRTTSSRNTSRAAPMCSRPSRRCG